MIGELIQKQFFKNISFKEITSKKPLRSPQSFVLKTNGQLSLESIALTISCYDHLRSLLARSDWEEMPRKPCGIFL